MSDFSSGRVLNSGEESDTTGPSLAPAGLRRTVLSTSNSHHEERIEALSAAFGDYKFELKDHNTRKQIVVTGTGDLTPQILSDMRRVARSV